MSLVPVPVVLRGKPFRLSGWRVLPPLALLLVGGLCVTAAQSAIPLTTRLISQKAFPTSGDATGGGTSSLYNSGGQLSGSGTSLSADGRWVVFQSNATDLVAGVTDVNGATDVFLRDTLERVTYLVSGPNGANTANGPSMDAMITRDGSKVVFRSTASNLIAGGTDANNAGDIFVYDVAQGVLTLVSHTAASASTTAAGGSRRGIISGDGNTVAFISNATNLVDGLTDANGADDVFAYDLATGAVQLVSHAAGSTIVLPENWTGG